MINRSFFSTVAIIGIAFTHASASACMCAPLGKSFFETVFLHNQKVQSGEWPAQEELTLLTALVKDYKQLRPGPYPTEMVLEVSDVIQGTLEKSELVVEGDNGMQCRPYVTEFQIGKKFIFAINKDKDGHYISACGVYSKEVTPLK